MEPVLNENTTKNVLHRRSFFAKLGGAAAVTAIAASCTKTSFTPASPANNLFSKSGATESVLPPGDLGVLNYAYLLEQIEAGFYTQVIMTPYSGIPSSELALLTDIRDHEIAHREFFKNALGSDAMAMVELDFSSVDFSSRSSVLATAKTFEDLGVSAYNGAGRLIQNPDYLVLAGKIVSVEARHAAYIRDLISPGSFADSTAVDSNGLDLFNRPATVLQAAQAFIKTNINGKNLPVF